jgi:hypothetical protein
MIQVGVGSWERGAESGERGVKNKVFIWLLFLIHIVNSVKIIYQLRTFLLFPAPRSSPFHLRIQQILQRIDLDAAHAFFGEDKIFGLPERN